MIYLITGLTLLGSLRQDDLIDSMFFIFLNGGAVFIFFASERDMDMFTPQLPTWEIQRTIYTRKCKILCRTYSHNQRDVHLYCLLFHYFQAVMYLRCIGVYRVTVCRVNPFWK